MKTFSLALIPALLFTTACAAAGTQPAGHWIQGANKMAIFVPARAEKNCKYVAGYVGKGPRASFGYNYVCEK